jgi:protocatechuate 3,4-dioxygenase beta subunit
MKNVRWEMENAIGDHMIKATIANCALIASLCIITAAGQISGGKIVGKVIERESLRTLAAEISIAGRDNRNLYLRHTKASEDGLFEIADLPAGELHLTTKLDGYATDHLSISLNNGETRYVEFYLTKGKTVRGVIHDQSNTPIAGARVNVAYVREATGLSSVTASYEWESVDTITDELGRYVINNLHPEEEFIIEAIHPKFPSIVSAPVRFNTQDEELSLNISASRGVEVVGVIRDANRNPLRSARVMLFDAVKSDYPQLSKSESTMDGRTHTLSNEAGAFSFAQVKPMKKMLVVLHPGYQPYRQTIDLTGRQTQLSIEVILQVRK